MLRRSKRLIVAVAAVGSLATVVPAHAWDGTVAPVPCRGDVAFRIEEWHQTVQVVGTYSKAGALDVDLTCGVVRYGETVARVGEDRPGPVAVVVGSARVLGGPISMCHEIAITYVEGYEHIDTCP